MQNKFILSPFFLDKILPGLERYASPQSHINKPELPLGRSQERMAFLYQPIADFVSQTIQHGSRPVSIAGDCCTSLGVLAGLERAGIQPTLIWFDAHGDFNTWETTPSGFLGGMPLAIAVGRGEQTIPDALKSKPFPETQVILSDARDLDPGEMEALANSRVRHIKDVVEIMDLTISGPVYVHFDTDIIDPSQAPAMNYKAEGGPFVDALQKVFRFLAENTQLITVSVSSWNPDLDEDGHTGQVCMELIAALLDKERITPVE